MKFRHHHLSRLPNIDKGNLNVNMYESVLRLQGAQQALSDTSDCKFILKFKVNWFNESFNIFWHRAELKANVERSVETWIRVK